MQTDFSWFKKKGTVTIIVSVIDLSYRIYPHPFIHLPAWKWAHGFLGYTELYEDTMTFMDAGMVYMCI